MQGVIQISAEAGAALVIGYFATVFAFGRVLLWQFERRCDTRDKSTDDLRAIENAHRASEMRDVQQSVTAESRRIATLGEQLHKFVATLPLEYVRREDHIRNQTVIEAKLDAIATELKMVQIKGSRNAD
jgi:hypothetical protein